MLRLSSSGAEVSEYGCLDFNSTWKKKKKFKVTENLRKLKISVCPSKTSKLSISLSKVHNIIFSYLSLLILKTKKITQFIAFSITTHFKFRVHILFFIKKKLCSPFKRIVKLLIGHLWEQMVNFLTCDVHTKHLFRKLMEADITIIALEVLKI